MRRIWTPIFVMSLALPAMGDEAPSAKKPITPQEADFFERKVRPILVDNCVSCHGPKTQKSGIRVDSRAALIEDQGSGAVVSPGIPDESPLIEVVRGDGSVKMPPSKPLSAEAVADLTTWVKMGAPWPDAQNLAAPGSSAGADPKKHWAFQPVRRGPLPAVKHQDWAKGGIDAYILAALEAKGLEPSPAADKRTLIRRATFDLIGLPPTPEEVAAFLADESPEAFARVVDRLLASPHYGERWGRYWLDVARYADTKGYILFEDANYPWAYTYRDYVIKSLNDDLPYDQFILEQLAADRLASAEDRRPLRAMGFLTLGSRFMNNVHDVIDDRIDVVTRGLLGLTVSCARCHDHKFDPIPTKDYYSLYGVFASSIEPTKPPLFEAPPATPQYESFAKELAQREAKLAEFVAGKHAELVDGAKKRAAEYLIAGQNALSQPSTEDFMLLADGGDLNPKMVIRWRVFLDRTRKKHDPVLAPWHAFAAMPTEGFADNAKAYCESLAKPEDGSHPINPIVAKEFAEHPPKSLVEASQTYACLFNQVEKPWQEAAQRDALNKAPRSPLPDPAMEALAQVFHGPDAPPEVPFDPYGDLALLPDRPAQAKLQELRNAVVTWRSTGPGAPPRAMALEDLPTPVEPRVFGRGNPNNLGPNVPRRFLEVLSPGERPAFQVGSGRLDLAKSIASKDNPLTARVLVNRVWMYHMGSPLVQTPSDFGLRSDPPSHPELLDHLAASFMDGGWSLKALHREIMLSNSYQQMSDDREEARKIDPENAFYWRMNGRRLDFESMRDTLLTVSGRLDPKLGGPSVADITGAATCRTVYAFVDRLNLPGIFRTFDFPDPNATSARRDATTVAPQALFFMNHPFMVNAAKGLLKRPEVAAEADLNRRVERIYGLLFQRPPAPEEAELARSFLNDEKATPEAWEHFVQPLLLCNELIFID
ncbi:PSD1 and planctomycete cytochrome C domain-containing protein [Singulisphaera sp. PoT]|uniref:PSD1 and planctomycete cytochrome C domain-containing protein n=1 Tax=Singulisphaera sp. PoT TaxID=3411797 RepID=UPI003BF59548